MAQPEAQFVTLNAENLETEHICCAFSDKKTEGGTLLKKKLIRQRLAEGFVFKKLDARAKVFIEYVPAENAWAPIHAPGYTFIHCFWVSGRYKNQGLGTRLLNECIRDSEGKNGIAVVVGKKKMPFLNDKKFFLKKGFEVCDAAPPYFELLVKKFNDAAPPEFNKNARKATLENAPGLTFYYSHLCPYSEYWTDQMMAFAEKYNLPVSKIKISSKEEAQNMPSGFALFSAFFNGKFLTHELTLEKKFDQLMQKVL